KNLHPQVAQAIQFGPGFYALTNDGDVQIPRGGYHTLHDSAPDRISIQIANQVHIQLDNAGLKIHQQVEPGVACAKVVDGGDKTPIAILGKNALKVIRVQHWLGFTDLEHDFFAGEIVGCCCFQSGANTSLRTIHGIRQKVDAQHGIHLQVRRQLYGLDTTELVKLIAVVVVYTGQNAWRSLSLGTAHQGFVGEHAVVGQIHNRLKGHGEFEIQWR